MTLMRGRLSAIEDEWHIRGIPEWLDPVFTFQRTWYEIPDRAESQNFNATLAKVFALLGGGLLGYYVWDRTHHKVYTGLAGAAGFVGAPLLVAAYDRYQQTPGEVTDEGAPDGQHDESASEQPTNTYTATGTETSPTLVPGSPQIKRTELAPSYTPGVISRPKYDPNALI